MALYGERGERRCSLRRPAIGHLSWNAAAKLKGIGLALNRSHTHNPMPRVLNLVKQSLLIAVMSGETPGSWDSHTAVGSAASN